MRTCLAAVAAVTVLVGAPLGWASVATPAAPADPTPMTAEAVPLFPGLNLEMEEPISSASAGSVLDDSGDPYPLLGGFTRTYATRATAEEVYAFYEQRLGGKVKHTQADDHNNIGPNQATPVIRKRLVHDFEPIDNDTTSRVITSAMQRNLLQSNRPPSSEGDWVSNGTFSWVARDRAGAPTSFDLQVIDESVASNWAGYTPRTVVTVQVERYGPVPNDED